MKFAIKAACASTALVAVCFASPAHSADMYGGSIKDGYMAPLPAVSRGAGPCYVRGDLGVGFSRDTGGSVDVFDQFTQGFQDVDRIDGPNTPPNGGADVTDVTPVFGAQNFPNQPVDTLVGSAFVTEDVGNFFFGEVGFGCGSGSRGLRADLTFGFRSSRDISFLPQARTQTWSVERNGPGLFYTDGTVNPNVPEFETTTTVTQEVWKTSIDSYSLLANFYYDLGNFRGFVPYVGAGIGVAFHDVERTDPESNGTFLEGEETMALAWQVSAGVGYQIRENMILDVGYRYLDLGDAKSGRVDSLGNTNPTVHYDNLQSHEIKVGLRYHFGSSGGCCETASFK